MRFYQGLDTIGGVILEIKYGNDRAFFEAGRTYNPSFDIFDGHVDKRKNFVSDYLWLNDIPRIDYIYRKEDIVNTELKSAEEAPFNQAFYITHLHLDHMGMMGMIDPGIPVYLSKPAQIIEAALEDMNMGVDSIRALNYSDLNDEMFLGQIHIKRFVLNDDSYQDYSFYIETPDLKVHYTGDIFVYGKYLNKIKNEIAYLNTKDLDILIPEGTTFWGDIDSDKYLSDKVNPTFKPDNLLTKAQHEQCIVDLIERHEGLLVFNIYEREMSDVLDFLNYAGETNRTIVFEPQSAYLINKFFNKKVKLIIPDTYKEELKWLEFVKSNNEIINKQVIINNPNSYLVQNSYPNLLELLDYKDSNLLYLHHSGQPLGAFDPKYHRLLAFLKTFNIEYKNTKEFNDKYFSSHSSPEQLIAYLNEIDCKLIIPCHSANRKAYVHNISKPYYWANLNETYVYDRENNTLKVLDDE